MTRLVQFSAKYYLENKQSFAFPMKTGPEGGSRTGDLRTGVFLILLHLRRSHLLFD